jgi:glycosyltransferase involved in cell wall biosynthesis
MGASVLILTLNEEINLPACLKSVKCCDDIVVLDSFSSDRTLEIAQGAGARVVQRRFDNYAAQRNSALKEIQYKNPWVFMIDADERVTPELMNEIEAAISQNEPEITLYRVRRKDIFWGRWLHHSSGYPTWFGRLIKIGHVWIERQVNEEYKTNGKVGYLREHLLHHPFNKGIKYWFERHNFYSSWEADILHGERSRSFKFLSLLSSDPVVRRKVLKQLAYRLPLRPLLVFFYLYFVRFGFLDGQPGITYCILRAIYEYMIVQKIKEIQRREMRLPV